MYIDMFRQMKRQLTQMDTWLEKASGFADQKKFDVNNLLTARLAPDQFALTRQVQIACDTAKLGASRLTGKDAPSHADDEKSIAELRARIASTIAYLDTFTDKDFEGTAARVITNPRWEGKHMVGHDYFFQHVVPNFGFHTAHVYALLRHNGVEVGKKDYLGALSLKS